ncbi:KH domain-containing protein [Tychonema sp. LEGE 07203]|uniref:KH domain-containing protein n=1 Tax=Tychonema sp. LEGE 07203 TaxID=1828671 RepID=UPI0018822EB9|nr:KH domain-containing protein [Tychonema sp. LEGE 07203]MBE9095765.1 KH domain-containing protein [Tychonema sp. LEGE 07203]
MYLNKSEPEPTLNPAQQQSASPNYAGLVQFLIGPFLESPGSLRVDCELHPRQSRVWVRLAFEEPDKGRVYGRGGRNIQAIRTTLEAVAQTVGQSLYLDIYDSEAGERGSGPPRGDRGTRDRGDFRPRTSPPPPSPLGSRPSREQPRRTNTPTFRTSRNTPGY